MYIERETGMAIAKRKLKTLETRLEARKELTRVKKASLLSLYILSN